ncbi:MAG: class I adenylate cyclase [Desulfobacter sp.]|nr:MAG: class I adenylate cyclase [Desulfobacter sp.]
MDQETPPENTLAAKLEKMKSAFSNYNVVRMREALRYLSGPKLKLFIQIPFLIHVNQPKYPGFVPGKPEACGIYNFENSGFCKEGLKQGQMPAAALPRESASQDPGILGLYHIGSLGTFTQSPQSDFDYWVIIDKTRFTEKRYYNLEKKLNHIVKYSREEFDQEVTFFIMDQADISRDCYAGFDTPETMIAPKLFLKEEFYRTFLMIAGKIPLWTILPGNMPKGAYTRLVDRLSQSRELSPLLKDFIDLGKVEIPEQKEILQGLSWHICKSREDPVKALIKATMILSHSAGKETDTMLLCDELKQGFSDAGIDDYEGDPYKIVFDRVLSFHEAHDPEGLSLIKNAIFFRLCEYPNVKIPEPGSPKKQLLDRYIRTWNLTPAQVRKLVSYPDWAEEEKRLLDTTFIKRLAQMYRQADQETPPTDDSPDPILERNLKILTHKVLERLNTSQNKIPASSNYLTRQAFEFFLFREQPPGEWALSGYLAGGAREITLYRSRTLLGLVGWMIENRLYHRNKAHIKVDVKRKLFESRDDSVSADALYLALQPVKPLSDDGFEHPARWTKIMVLLTAGDTDGGISRIELLAVNSWGEMFEDQLRLDTTDKLTHRYKTIADKINQYKGEAVRLFFYQLSERRDPDAVYEIKQLLAARFLTNRPDTPVRKRPLLDKL